VQSQWLTPLSQRWPWAALPWPRTTRINHQFPAAAPKPRGKQVAAPGSQRTSDRRRSVIGNRRPRMYRRALTKTSERDLPRTGRSIGNCASAAIA